MGGSSGYGTKHRSYRCAQLFLAQIKARIVRLGAIVHRVAALEKRAIGLAGVKQGFEIWLGGDGIIAIGNIDPTLHLRRKDGRRHRYINEGTPLRAPEPGSVV